MAVEYAPVYTIEPFGITIPLPIAPTDLTDKQRSEGMDKHHAVFHSSTLEINYPFPDLQPSDTALAYYRAIRWARLQYGSRWLHRNYHDLYPEGVPMPQNQHEHFIGTLALSTDFLPPEAIDVSGRKPRRVRLTEGMRAQLHEPGVLQRQRGRQWAIGYFLANYILEHGLDSVIETEEVARFMDETTDETTRRRLSFAIIRQATETVVEPFEPFYRSAREEGSISYLHPQSARRFVVKYFQQHQPDYIPELEQRFLADAA